MNLMNKNKRDYDYYVRVGGVIVVFFVIFAIGGYELFTIDRSNERTRLLKKDIKARCDAVYNTIEGRRVTTIYSCPADDGGDDVKYEFTERL